MNTLFDEDEAYKAFVEKFKPKKTTDDCCTPQNIYDAIVKWCVQEYGINERDIVRPFWPGGDYEHDEYKDGCVVLDNPPFSIISQIVKFYNQRGIKYFLFAPYLTNLGIRGTQHLVTGISITYENGAKVSTSFVTNMDKYCIRSVPDLRQIIEAEEKRNRAENKTELPRYEYPDCVITSTSIGAFSKYGIDFNLANDELTFIRELDAQKPYGKALFGSGFLLSREAEQRRREAEQRRREAEQRRREAEQRQVWKLSEREKAIQAAIGVYKTSEQ